MRHSLRPLLTATLLFTAACSSSSPSSGTGTPNVDGGGAAPKIYCERGIGTDDCTCIGDDTRGGSPTECSTASPANSYCCADTNYPSSGTCQCVPWACNEGSSHKLCLCGISENADPAGTQCTPSLLCCEKPSSDGSVVSCSCKETFGSGDTCAADEVVVPSCGVSAARCGAGQMLVRSCTP